MRCARPLTPAALVPFASDNEVVARGNVEQREMLIAVIRVMKRKHPYDRANE